MPRNVSSTQDHVYVNISIQNREDDDTGGNPVVQFSENRSTPILTNPRDWDFSIIRFQIDTGNSIPMWIPVIKRGQSDRNLTIYHISLYYRMKNGAAATIYESFQTRQVVFESQYTQESTGSPLLNQDLSTKYYWVNSFQHVCKIFNDNFEVLNQAVQTDLETQFGGAITGMPVAPHLRYNKNGERFQFYMDKTGFNTTDADFPGSGAGNFGYVGQMYFDSNMFGLFPNVHHKNEGTDTKNAKGRDRFTYRIIPIDDLGTNSYTYDSVDYLIMEQDFASVSSLWAPIQSIVFTSNLLPVVAENESSPLVFENGNLVSTSSSSQYVKALTDFEVPLSSCADWKQQITYSPSNYRIISLSDTTDPIRVIDIQAFLRLKQNNQLIPLRLYNQATLSMKLMFRHKSAR